MIDPEAIDAAGLKSGDVVPLRRDKGKGSVYAFHCILCMATWKVYQNVYHHATCPYDRVAELEADGKED